MDNNFEQDDGDEIVEDDELIGMDSDVIMDDAIDIDDDDDDNDYFEPPPHIIFLNETGPDSADENGGETAGASSSTGEATPDDFSLANLTPEQIKAINEFSLEKHTKVDLNPTKN